MKLKFLGAAGTVTGSKTLIESSGRKYLVDCGLFQGIKSLRVQNWEALPVKPSEIDTVFLTHAHIDHSGYLPRLFREGFRGRVICTVATKDLCQILLLDSAKLMEEEARYANKKGFSKHHPALPLFTHEDAEGVLKCFEAVPFHTDVQVNPGVSVRFKRAGHILGAASVRLDFDGTRVTFSGDVGRPNDPVLLRPEPLDETDLLVVESTYGDRRHSQEDPVNELADIIRTAEVNGGSVLIPAFAVGRAQELLYFLMKVRESGRVPPWPVYLDSPMAKETTGVFCEHLDDHRLSREVCDRMLDGVRLVGDLEESISIQEDSRPKIVISASGMATGGRVLHYMKKMASDSRNIILFAGYQAAGTRGALLVAGAKQVKIHGEYFDVNAGVRLLGNLSAHADADEILAWLAESPQCRPKQVFITHGEAGAADAMRVRLRDRFGWSCRIPAQNDQFEFMNL